MEDKLDYLNLVLDRGLRVLVYHGMYDLVLPVSGMNEVLEASNWTKKDEWSRAPRSPYILEASSDSDKLQKSELMGYRQSGGGLTFVVVRNSGHMVPIDQPEWSLKIVDDFLQANP